MARRATSEFSEDIPPPLDTEPISNVESHHDNILPHPYEAADPLTVLIRQKKLKYRLWKVLRSFVPPPVFWVRLYNLSKLKGDLIAVVVVFVVLLTYERD